MPPIRLSNAVPATIQDPVGRWIPNDDVAVATISIGDATYNEANAGSVSTAFGVVLSADSRGFGRFFRGCADSEIPDLYEQSYHGAGSVTATHPPCP